MTLPVEQRTIWYGRSSACLMSQAPQQSQALLSSDGIWRCQHEPVPARRTTAYGTARRINGPLQQAARYAVTARHGQQPPLPLQLLSSDGIQSVGDKPSPLPSHGQYSSVTKNRRGSDE
jgi:hypothetical protein